MQVFMQKNDVCLQNFIFLHKRLLFAGLCERIFEVGLPLAMSVSSKIHNLKMQVFRHKNANNLHFSLHTRAIK